MGNPNLKILIVDDDAGVRMSLSRALNSKGYDVREMSNGTDALAFIANETVGLALIDIRLPDLNGI